MRAIMRISHNFYTTQNLFRYSLNCTLLSSFSPKTLNPNTPQHTLSPSKSLCAISSICNFPSGSSSFFSFDSCTLQKRQSLCTFSSGSASKCFPNPYVPIKTHFLSSFSSWSSSRCKFGSLSRCKKQSLGSSTLLKHNSDHICSSSIYLYSANVHRYFTASSSNGAFNSVSVVESEVEGVANVFSDQQKLEKTNNFSRKFVLEIIDDIRNNRDDLESRLGVQASRLSVYSITEIFEVLNTHRIPGLRFFEWIWTNIPQVHKNAHVCSLIIDNIGRLGDYETMSTLLKKFTSKNICLTYEAFGFLPVFVSTDSSLTDSTKKVVDLLNKVGGSCRSSGICALVEMFCKLDLFEMAIYVIKITESKQSYYRLLIREKCRKGLTEDAHGIIREMGEAHCASNTTVYNYLLGSLCTNGRKNEASALLDEMKEIGIPPDAITFEILINFECRLGKMDVVHELLDQMVSLCLEPRLSTHISIVKSLFNTEKYEAAHKYVVDSSTIYKTSSNVMYSLLANLYQEKGDIMSARNTLVEMMEKNLKPNFIIYVKIVKQLRRIGRTILARDLECRHSKFVIKSRGSHL
ncbi:hypothetical protein BUALT_Bualt08G0146900 [Buddleja alternifolia]|uniref:Pentatricopeptide repeat-containing protein n=1 Tax=Buddleja alternifolia TaxID=168488 RepID=A0AAV6XHE1_9LAMI|nr:hypothetical protein BUALT_Bualt08G0146900 [Buddleja alternifolia]